MQENQPLAPEQQEAPAAQTAPVVSPKKKIYNKPWFIVLLCLGGVVLLALPVVFLMLNSSGGGTADKFYGMVEATALKSKIRYAYTLTIPRKGQQPSVDVKSLSEYDSATGEFSTAYVSEAIVTIASRCVKGKEYESTGDDKYPDDLKAAEVTLKGPYKVSDDKFNSGACEFKKPRYYGDFTDGMLAVGLKPEQAKNMADNLRRSGPAKLTDNGTTTYKGKAARKISFEVGKTLTGSSYQSDAFFYSFRDGTSDTVGANVPVNEISKHFDDTFQVPPVGLKGFYLIDEKTNLPLYRYLETVADGGGNADFAPKTMLSEYSFPETLTMDETTQLPEISKL